MRALACACILAITGIALVEGLHPPRVAIGGPEAAGTVAVVGRERVTAEDLSAFWHTRNRLDWMQTVDSLIDERLVNHEVRRLGLSLPPGVLGKAVDEEVAARRKQLRETYGEKADLAEEVLDGYGLDLAVWRQTILAPRLRTKLLLERVIRLDTRRRDRVKARVIVCPDQAAAQRVLTQLRRGADFSLTALKESVDPTAQSGGDLPSIARGDLVIPGVEDQLFAAEAGALVGPIAVSLEGRTSWHLYKVIRRIPAWSGSRGELVAKLEEDLATYPVERPEFERWRARMRRDFRVTVYDPNGRPIGTPAGN